MSLRYEKLYIITRRDLSPGLQCAQVAHAAFQFAYEHRPLAAQWLQESNFLIILSEENEERLIAFGKWIEQNNIPVTWFTEPDINDQVTAIALAPSPRTVELCKTLPLAMRELMVKPTVTADSLLRYVEIETPDRIVINLRGTEA